MSKMAAQGHPMIVVGGIRTAAEQHALWRQGREIPGKIVTNLDGIHHPSRHQPHADGYGHALDIVFIVDGKPSWAEDLPWDAYGKEAEAAGLVWGGRFVKLVDRPHVELPEKA
jgi:peptidoglycan L-alanyl-D-glutamate endopeptidase CwlK